MAGLGEAVDRRQRRRRPAREDDRAARLDRLVADDDALLAVEPSPPAEQRDTALLEPGQLGLSSRSWMISSRRSSTAVTSSSPVAAWAAPGTRRASARTSPGRSSALGRHARPERALATDLAVLDDRHLQPRLRQSSGRHLAAGSRADHHHVEGVHRRRLTAAAYPVLTAA